MCAERAANRSFLIDPTGEIAARYDKIHMFDVDLANGESYRESANYRAGRAAVLADLPWGRLGLTICYDLRFPPLYRALAEAGASFITIPRPSPSRPAKPIGMCSCAPAPSRRAASCSRPPRAAATRTAARPLVIRWSSTPGASILAEGGTEPGVVLAEIEPARIATPAQHSVAAAWPTIRDSSRASRLICTWCGARYDPLRAPLRQGPRIRELVRSPPPTTSRRKRGLVNCPICGSNKVEKALMAPRLPERANPAPPHRSMRSRGRPTRRPPPSPRPRSR